MESARHALDGSSAAGSLGRELAWSRALVHGLLPRLEPFFGYETTAATAYLAWRSSVVASVMAACRAQIGGSGRVPHVSEQSARVKGGFHERMVR